MTVLEAARDAVAAGPLCDPCLGRCFADRSFGLTNRERGRSLRIALALEADEPYESAAEDGRDEACWVCEGECARFDTWAERAAAALRGYEFETYQVGTRVPPLFEENERLLREDAGLSPDAGEALKSEFNREVGKRLGAETGTEVDFERPDVVVLCDLSTDEIELQVNSAFVYGRYRKLEREIPQTEWPCTDCHGTGLVQGEPCAGCDGTGYRYDDSVEGYTAPHARDAMDGEAAVFHGAGREDVDARMLGTGRPFVLEVEEPRTRDVDVEALAARINDAADGAVEVEGLRPATHEMVERVKELDASKRYRMAVAFDEPVAAADLADALAELSGARIHQETPQRVDHRRASKTRTRQVYEAEGVLTDGDPSDDALAERELAELATDETAGDAGVIEIHGEGGLYVKELVSGDEGRTDPSLAGLLGTGADVTALDVRAVTGEDEPFARPEFFRDEA